MGIFIHMSISKAVEKKEWEAVYQETLQLVEAFPFAERLKVSCEGVETYCLVRTKERQKKYGWRGDKTRIGWTVDGDYETMRTAEEYFLPKDFINEKKVNPDAGDAILGVLPCYLDYSWDDPLCSHCYEIWGNKTQGRPYHMYLLAVACLIEARLGEKAFVYGDITRGQCKKAVELANKYLEKPIEIPDRCDVNRLWRRVSKLPIKEMEKFEAFERFYLGTKDAQFGEYLRAVVPEHIYDEYWKRRFQDCHIETIGFDAAINDYFLWGFDLRKLCRRIDFEMEMNHAKGKNVYEKFVQRILDANLHVKEKDCEDILNINQEEESPYSIYTLMAQFVFAGAHNNKVNRYIPIEEIRDVLKQELGAHCDVDVIIDGYSEEKEEVSEIFQRNMDTLRQTLQEGKEEYNIYDYEDLIYFEKGDKIKPDLEEALKSSFEFYNSLLDEEDYITLMEKPAEIRCRWLTEHNKSILIRDTDWCKIFRDIKQNPDSFRRYYPMVRVMAESNDLRDMVKAIVMNDDLYKEYS